MDDTGQEHSGGASVLHARSRSVMTGEQMATLHQPSAPNPLERPLKMGWLRKQRSIVKNWQQRYFVLRAQQLYYYKDEEDTKPQVLDP
ncbi:rho GTPase-activating protein 25-like [Leptonychotes weddellii]|uniref:Rho GTPase-activating protein 25-like n=1 Tax=Leptonychotes weddellii TaxID=9713 RepID=A0A7F8QGE4_LEPWE|nr:rho GTPase-activating protein 25-like [Leptonychotes weddellii]